MDLKCIDTDLEKIDTKQYHWAWKYTSELPSKTSETTEWIEYSDIDNEIIEEAYQANKKFVILDDGYVDFEKQVNIEDDTDANPRLMRRSAIKEKIASVRKDRFMPNPMASSNTFAQVTDFRDPIFLKKIVDVSKLTRKEMNQKMCELVDAAISGILKEGSLLGKSKTAQWMCKQLEKVKDGTSKEIGDCCVNLYTRESFLYRILNHTMRLCADKEQENKWASKVETLGPFALILFQHVLNEGRYAETIYRGALLTEENIQEFRELASRNRWVSQSFQSFVSCTKNRDVADIYGNVLFEIKLSRTFRAMNISHLSRFPEEEELLLPAGITFGVESVIYNPDNGKYVIKLWVPIYNPHDD